jgi:hypothetical protein
MCPQQLDHKDARIHCAILNKHTTHNHPSQQHPETRSRPATSHGSPSRRPNHTVVPSGPNRVSTATTNRTTRRSHPHQEGCTRRAAAADNDSPVSPPTEQPPPKHPSGTGLCPAFTGKTLLRKEVIQPHLPVRLPCYDFVPIASPTFDGSLHKGWATGFGCCRLS